MCDPIKAEAALIRLMPKSAREVGRIDPVDDALGFEFDDVASVSVLAMIVRSKGLVILGRAPASASADPCDRDRCQGRDEELPDVMVHDAGPLAVHSVRKGSWPLQ
jgi:hypothetical protein